MKKLTYLIVAILISTILSLSGCGLTSPECPEVCPEIPACPGCPDCICPAGSSCSCSTCPDCNCSACPECECECGCPEGGAPIIINGILSPSEWDCATVIALQAERNGLSSMGDVMVLATTDYLYVAFVVADLTDPRTDVTSPGLSDKFAINVNPTDNAPFGMPCELIFQIAADPATFGGTSSGQIDGFETYWGNGLVQEPTLPTDLESVTVYGGGTGTTEWKIPLVSTPGDVIKVGGVADIENQSYKYPVGLDPDWADASTYVDIVVY